MTPGPIIARRFQFEIHAIRKMFPRREISLLVRKMERGRRPSRAWVRASRTRLTGAEAVMGSVQSTSPRMLRGKVIVRLSTKPHNARRNLRVVTGARLARVRRGEWGA